VSSAGDGDGDGDGDARVKTTEEMEEEVMEGVVRED
jgi:hypothetical protein